MLLVALLARLASWSLALAFMAAAGSPFCAEAHEVLGPESKMRKHRQLPNPVGRAIRVLAGTLSPNQQRQSS